MGKTKSMHYQAATVLGSATCFGRSKHADKRSGNNYHPHGIYSVKTLDNYVTMVSRYGKWCKETYGEKDLKACARYAAAYLDHLKELGRSACTIHTYKFAIQKFYDILHHGFKLEYETEKRTRARITKNRSSIEEVKDFDEKKHKFALDFGMATGLRRACLENLRYSDIHYDAATDTYSVHVFNGKGGKKREVRQIPRTYNAMFASLYAFSFSDDNIFYKSGKKEKIIGEKGKDINHILPDRFPEHRCRRIYANTLYRELARDPADIKDPHEKYYCRKDLKGVIYDRVAMLEVSKNLGHERVSVIATNYLKA